MSAPGTGRILVSAETLFVGDGLEVPEPEADAGLALERLAWIGEPVVVVGDQIAGRRLPDDLDDRIAWVLQQLGEPEVAAAVLESPDGARPGEDAERAASERWGCLRDTWQADRLLTSDDASVVPARRAGLTVIHIGPRAGGQGVAVERADHEARDLRDAVSQLLAADVFGDAPSG